jgi:hypothetical protein
VGGNGSQELRHARTRKLLAHAAGQRDDAGTLFDHPLLRIEIGGRRVFLEPDLVAFQMRGRFHVVEIKSFAVIDGQADGAKVAAAATQSAVYVLALRRLLAELGFDDPEIVSHDVVLICPENFSNRPVATLIDVRKKLGVLERQLARLSRIDTIVATLPPDLSFDLSLDARGEPTRSVGELVDGLRQIDPRYAPECLSTCEFAFFCRDESRGSTAALGKAVREDLGGLESVDTALGLAAGRLLPADDQAEVAAVLQLAARLRRECLGGAA